MAWPDSDYPGGLDSPPDPDTTLAGTPLHSELHLFVHDAIEKIEGTLGTNPQGSQATVGARFVAVEGSSIRRYASTTARDAAITAPSEGMYAYTADTNREWRYNGTNWVISGGDWPMASRTRSISFTLATGTTTNVTLENSLYDNAGLYTGSATFTIPTGLGGDYMLTAGVKFASNSTNIRSIDVAIGSNTTTANEVSSVVQTAAAHVTSGVALNIAKLLRLEAGATVTLRAYQNSGGNLDVEGAYVTLKMERHVPTLT